MKEVPGSWSSVIWSRLGGKPSRPSTSSREEVEAAAEEVAGAAVDMLAVFKKQEESRGEVFILYV